MEYCKKICHCASRVATKAKVALRLWRRMPRLPFDFRDQCHGHAPRAAVCRPISVDDRPRQVNSSGHLFGLIHSRCPHLGFRFPVYCDFYPRLMFFACFSSSFAACWVLDFPWSVPNVLHLCSAPPHLVRHPLHVPRLEGSLIVHQHVLPSRGFVTYEDASPPQTLKLRHSPWQRQSSKVAQC